MIHIIHTINTSPSPFYIMTSSIRVCWMTNSWATWLIVCRCCACVRLNLQIMCRLRGCMCVCSNAWHQSKWIYHWPRALSWCANRARVAGHRHWTWYHLGMLHIWTRSLSIMYVRWMPLVWFDVFLWIGWVGEPTAACWGLYRTLWLGWVSKN